MSYIRQDFKGVKIGIFSTLHESGVFINNPYSEDGN